MNVYCVLHGVKRPATVKEILMFALWTTVILTDLSLSRVPVIIFYYIANK